jgi:hypothetical protein
MKLRTTTLLMLTWLMMSSLASAATAAPSSQPADPDTLNLAQLSSGQTSSTNCMTKKSSDDDFFTEQILCGACSDSACQGKSSGNVCGFRNGQTYRCQLVIVNCSYSDCTCWTGPLP